MAQATESQPPEPDNSSPSDAMTANDVDRDSGDGAVPYGTRSRNRTGNSRPNYAEDKDIEMDNYEYYDKKDADATKKSSRIAAANGDSSRSSSQRKVASDDSKAVTAQNGSKDTGSLASSNPQGGQNLAASAASRKRKAATAGQQTTAPSTGSQRRTGNSTPSSTTNWPESNMLTFENCKGRPHQGQMIADDGTILAPNDHVYLVCEPPGEPYYLGRIMEFLHAKNDPSKPVDALRINWYYRPKDIGRKAPDTRLLYASMHSDISPLTALRGKCQIRHRVEIASLEEYRKIPDSFWYEKLYDRYIQKNYDLIPTSAIVNVPERVKKVLDERWKFVLVEQGRGKELTSAVKLCKRCSAYCASNDSVDCAVCKNTYHMNCVSPPLLKKPSRGFAWSCAACSRAQERKLEARHATNGTDGEGDDDDAMDEDDDDFAGQHTNRTTPAEEVVHHEGTPEQIYQASLWPYRYLGAHCTPEDALDYDDRIYPRASTAIGPRHQANVLPWPGRPVEYEKPLDFKRGKRDAKLTKDQLAALEAEKAKRSQRPKWVQDEPPGYTVRGEDFDENDPDCTAYPMWIRPEEGKPPMDKVISYMDEARTMSKKLGLPENSTNLQDVALTSYLREGYDGEKAIELLPTLPREDFDEPKLTTAEEKKFDEAISKFGSELHAVMKHVKTMTPGQVVRYYYTWKKSERGSKIWSSYSGRKGKKQAKLAEAAATKMADDVADKDDDSAFDSNKAIEKKRGFICQFCSTTTSRQWRRAPNAVQFMLDEETGKPRQDKANQSVVALCRRCAELWRRYAIRWEDVEEVAKKVAQAGGKAWKRKQDEELLKEIQAVQDLGLTPDRDSTPLSSIIAAAGLEPPRKKLKGAFDKDFDAAVSDAGSVAGSKKNGRTTESTPVPDMPKPRTLPCAICDQLEPLGDQHVSCRECRLTVHRTCYGVTNNRVQGRWLCDMCTNDKDPRVSVHYKCVLCPIEHTEQEFIDQPKLTHHKKKMSDKDREREKIEVQQARKAAELYRKRQEELYRPVNPREALKRTADNNWVHVTCAIWTPEVKFGSAKALQPAEGIATIPRPRYEDVCKACHQSNGACIPCHHCRAPYHVECARQQGHLLAFDITPIKGSRRDQFNIVTINGESGAMTAALWCKDHVPTKTIAHRIYEVVDDTGLTALQLFARNFKQADVSLHGAARRASVVAAGVKVLPGSASRRTSAVHGPNGAWTNGDHHDGDTKMRDAGSKVCISCGVDVTPKWWSIDDQQQANGALGSEAQKFAEQRTHQCHKCKKMSRTPRPPQHQQLPPPPEADHSRAYPTNPPTSSSHMPSLRSPPQADYRDPSNGRTPWPRTSPSPSDWPKHPQPAPPPLGRYPPPSAQVYQPAPPAPPSRSSQYGSDWGHRPSSQHGSPPRRYDMPGWPTPPQPPQPGPPMSSFGVLRMTPNPPPSAPPASQPPLQMHSNGLPPSPRRGPAPPSPYMSPYHENHHRPPMPGPPPMPAKGPLPARDSFTHGLHPRGAPPYGSQHGSPPMHNHGLPPPREPMAPRPPPENRPPSGASASPSLRNLLS